MKPVRLNREMVLENAQRASDGAGGFTETWVPLGRHWVQLRSRPGRESTLGATLLSRATHQILLRGRPFGAASRPVPKQRFREGERVFRILGVAEFDVDARYIVCSAVEETVA